MARSRTAPAAASEEEELAHLPEEAERLAREASQEPEPGPEVRPEEFVQGTGAPVWASPLPEDVVNELRKPLDPNRVRTRQGRGSGKFEYLAGHDVKRRANELFGFGNWGSRLVRIEETARVEVQSGGGTPKPGWHVSYMAVVEVTVRDCLPFSDVGYGDGVEYGPAALATARELATKEAATDALKRALTGWGDQFGLILYAKGDEKQRIDRDRNAEGAAAVRRDPEPGVPSNWAEWGARFASLLGGGDRGTAMAREWLSEAVKLKWGPDATIGNLSPAESREAAVLASSVLLQLETAELGDLDFHPAPRAVVRAAFLDKWKVEPDGPPWRMSAAEQDRPEWAPPEPTPETPVSGPQEPAPAPAARDGAPVPEEAEPTQEALT